jgi:endo-1,4-beta-D-glucanase Y
MAWQQVRQNGKIIDNPDGGNDSATDGDMDIAYALLLAHRQWGSTGAINYRKAAIACMHGLMAKVVNQSQWILKLGDWAESSDAKYGKATRTSDFMFDHLRVFAAVDTANAAKWKKVHDKTVSIVNYQYNQGGSKATGLLPDFMRRNSNGAYVPVSGVFLEDKHDGDYNYNACRIPWRLPMEYLLTGSTAIKSQLTTLNSWIRDKTEDDPSNVLAGYYVKNGPNGKSFADYNDLCFECPFAVSAMIGSGNQAWLDSLWSRMINDYPITDNYYFGNTIKMLVMITVSGNWWDPSAS